MTVWNKLILFQDRKNNANPTANLDPFSVIYSDYFLSDKVKHKDSGFLTDLLLGSQGNVYPMFDITWNHCQENIKILAIIEFTSHMKVKQKSL